MSFIMFISCQTRQWNFPRKELTVDEQYLDYQGFPMALNRSRNVLNMSLS